MSERLDHTPDNPKGKAFNEDLTARPKDTGASTEDDLGDITAQPFDYGRTEEEDAKISGYTDEKGQAVSPSKSKDGKPESPTGSYTDVGEGRSSAIRRS